MELFYFSCIISFRLMQGKLMALTYQFPNIETSHISIVELAQRVLDWNDCRTDNSPFFDFYQSERGYLGERIFLIKNNESIPENYNYNAGFLKFQSPGVRGYFRIANRGGGSNLSYGPHPTFIDSQGKKSLVTPEFLLCAKGEMTVTNQSLALEKNRSDIDFFAEFLRTFANDHPLIRDNWEVSDEARKITDAAKSKTVNLRPVRDTGSQIKPERMVATI